MGDPRKRRKKYSTPQHPWIRERIDKERGIMKSYGLKNKKEIWKAESLLKRFREQAKKLISDTSEQGKKEEKQLFDKLIRLGLVDKSVKVESVLDLELEDVLERRLQTLVFKKELAKSVDQARQFIVHGHINIGEGKMTVPSYLVGVEEEVLLSFNNKSDLSKVDHPERFVKKENTKIVKKDDDLTEENLLEKDSAKEKKEVKGKVEKKEKVTEKKEKKVKENKVNAKGPKVEVPKAEDLVKEKVDVEK